jgi:aminopeptidase N
LFDVADDSDWAFQRRRTVELDVDGARTPVPQLTGEIASDFALLNDGDLAYARLALDAGSLEVLLKGRLQLDDDLARAVVWGSLWDMVRSAELRAGDYLDISIRCIDIETDPAIFQSLMFRTFAAFEEYASLARRGELRERMARAAFDHLQRIRPGSDLQLHWTYAFIDAARRPADLDWVAGLLDGRTRLDGMTVDFAVRWAAVTALATAGAAGQEVIADELERDPTDMGRRAAAAARAARPLPEAKAEVWEAVANGRVSLATKRALADGFHRPDQESLLAEYVQPYFDTLLPFWESHDIDEALMFVRWMYPMTVITPEVVALTDKWLARDLPGPMKRSLLESQDGTRRALRTRAFDSDQRGRA